MLKEFRTECVTTRRSECFRINSTATYAWLLISTLDLRAVSYH